MTFNREAEVRMLLQELGRLAELLLSIGPQSVTVVIEEDVLHAARKHLLLSLRDCGWWRWRGYGYARRCLLCASCAFGSEPIRGRSSRAYGLRSVGFHRTYAVNVHVGCVLGLPGELRRLPRLDGIRIGRKRRGRRHRRRRRWRRCRHRFLMTSGNQQQRCQGYDPKTASPQFQFRLHKISVFVRAIYLKLQFG